MFDEKIKKELAIINALLRSEEYAYEMAEALNAGYDNEEQKEFINEEEKTALLHKSVKEEKIAISIAAFYALECGIGLLSEQTNQSPVQWLQKIVNKTLEPGDILLLSRFSNATWKAGQPFRSLKRITRHNFTGADYLSEADVKKDNDQVFAAGAKLLQQMNMPGTSSLPEQMNQLKIILQDTAFAFEMAKHLHTCYYIDQHLPVPLFVNPGDDTAIIQKSVREQKIATSIAGFYALECGMNYLVAKKGLVPSEILKSILNNSIDDADKKLFLRFANATWKAGQPFRDLKRITRHIFAPAYFLTKEDIEKDMLQIRTSAHKLLQSIEAIEKRYTNDE